MANPGFDGERLQKAVSQLKWNGSGEQLSSIASGSAGKTVKAKMEQNKALTDAIARGDMAQVQKNLKEILSSPEGAELTRQLRAMLKK